MKDSLLTIVPENMFKNQKRLRRLYLSNNLLRNVTKGTLNGLDTKIESFVFVIEIEKQFFTGLVSLEMLFLDFNRIESFELDDLEQLKSLHMLNLSYNFLSFSENQRFPNLPNIYELWVHLFCDLC